jgi:hypothetical protein
MDVCKGLFLAITAPEADAPESKEGTLVGRIDPPPDLLKEA